MPSSMNGSGYDTPDLHKDDLSDEGMHIAYNYCLTRTVS
jgi:hypothetical protein